MKRSQNSGVKTQTLINVCLDLNIRGEKTLKEGKKEESVNYTLISSVWSTLQIFHSTVTFVPAGEPVFVLSLIHI